MSFVKRVLYEVQSATTPASGDEISARVRLPRSDQTVGEIGDLQSFKVIVDSQLMEFLALF